MHEEIVGSRSWNELVFGKYPKRTLVRVCLWAASVNLFFHALLLPIQVEGSSMQPTYESGALNLVNRLSYLRQKPARGDVVVIDLGRAEGLLIKRIIGLPGEEVVIEEGRLRINGRLLIDAYAYDEIPWESERVRLNSDEYFFIGDNRAHSVFGVVSKGRILGKVLF